MVDDHPPILDGYRLLMENDCNGYDLEFDRAYDCEQSLEAIRLNAETPFQIILLDINLPPSKKYGLANGEDLGLRIRRESDSRIVVLTSLSDPWRISSILKNLRPEGMLLKTEITGAMLLNAMESVLSGSTYLSDKILKIKMDMDSGQDHCLDEYDLKILYHLATGEKTKNLPFHLPLSMSSIERRKKKLKVFFELEDSTDIELLEKARRKGFI